MKVDKKSIVKLVFSKDNRVLYFSRSTIPFDVNQNSLHLFKHLSVILFSKNALIKIFKIKKISLEIKEDIELLRALDNGFYISVLK